MATMMATALVDERDSLTAGKIAAERALFNLKNQDADLCIFFASISYDFKNLISGIQSVTGDKTQIIGCSSSGEFTSDRINNNSLALALISSDKYSFKAAAYSGVSTGLDALIENLKGDLENFTRQDEKISILMLADGLAGKGEEIVLSAFTAFNTEVKIIGGLAGNDFKINKTIVAANGLVCTDGICVCAVKGGDIFASGTKHGYSPISEPLLATKAKGNILYTINNKPAWQVWKDTVRDKALQRGIDVDALENSEDCISLLFRYELGLLTEDGYKIRAPLSKNSDDSLNFGSSIHEGITFRIMDGTEEDQIASAGMAAALAVKDLKGRKPVGALIFDCVCRAAVLEDEYPKAIAEIKKELGDIPIIGFQTFGEICINPAQLTGFHNTTTVIAIITE